MLRFWLLGLWGGGNPTVTINCLTIIETGTSFPFLILLILLNWYVLAAYVLLCHRIINSGVLAKKKSTVIKMQHIVKSKGLLSNISSVWEQESEEGTQDCESLQQDILVWPEDNWLWQPQEFSPVWPLCIYLDASLTMLSGACFSVHRTETLMV